MTQSSATSELEKTDRAAIHCTVGIVGAGAIGCFLGGILSQDKHLEVQFFGRETIGQELAEHGGFGGGIHSPPTPCRILYFTGNLVRM